MQESIYVGLDLGSSRCQQGAINGDGSLIFSRVVPTSEQHLRDAFGGLEGNVRVHLEAGELAAWAAGIINAAEDPRDNACDVALDEAVPRRRVRTGSGSDWVRVS